MITEQTHRVVAKVVVTEEPLDSTDFNEQVFHPVWWLWPIAPILWLVFWPRKIRGSAKVFRLMLHVTFFPRQDAGQSLLPIPQSRQVIEGEGFRFHRRVEETERVNSLTIKRRVRWIVHTEGIRDGLVFLGATLGAPETWMRTCDIQAVEP